MALFDGANMQYLYGGWLVDFHLPPKASFMGKVVNTFFRDIKLRKLIKRNNIDILYTFTGLRNKQTRFKYNTVKIISARDYGVMCKRYREFDAALDCSDAMICNSQYMREYYLSKYPDQKEKVFTVYNIIDVEQILQQSIDKVETSFDNFIDTHDGSIVSVGRFCKEKGFEFLIESFVEIRKKEKNYGLVLVGDGEYKDKYLKLIEEHHIQDHVYFTGYQKNPYKYMAKCDCFVLSSLNEGFPNVLAEAMALKLPVIATNCLTGPAEILREDMNYDAVTDKLERCSFGILTPRLKEQDNANAIHQLADAIVMLLSDCALREYYAQKSEQRAADFSEVTALQTLNAIFDKLVRKRKGEGK